MGVGGAVVAVGASGMLVGDGSAGTFAGVAAGSAGVSVGSPLPAPLESVAVGSGATAVGRCPVGGVGVIGETVGEAAESPGACSLVTGVGKVVI